MSSEEAADRKSKDSGTGSASALPMKYSTLLYHFEQYDIIVKLTSDGRFVGIEEVRINKDFRSYKQSIAQKIFREIDEYEPE